MNDSELKIEWFSGTGKGGQHRNKHQNCCRITHIPTGITKIGTSSRERMKNLIEAKKALTDIIKNDISYSEYVKINKSRKEQVGSGMRGDKRRTYRFRDNSVIDHISGKSATCDEIMNGNFHKLWKKE